ncbi:MAG: potassium transporter TrkG [Candidatus Krumholzibacteriia bacterium]
MRRLSRLRPTPSLRRSVLVAAGLCGLAALIVEYGTDLSARDRTLVRFLTGAAVGLFLVEQALAAVAVRPWRRWLRERWPTLLLSALLLAEMSLLLLFRHSAGVNRFLEQLHLPSLTRAYVVLAQFYILARLAVGLPRVHRRLAAARVRPAIAMMVIFFGVILGGTGLLLLPRATPAAAPITVLDALFTATSAVCVTGLIVRDTAVDFTVTGQVIIMILIQLGGLGIMSLTAFLSLLLGRGIGVRESSMLREVFQVPLWSDVGRVLRFIVILTLVAEAIGTAVLYWGLRDVIVAPGPRLFAAAFHAVSAYCNAGFSLFSGSLVGLDEHPIVAGAIAVLLVAGGLGFTVAAQLTDTARGRLRGRGRAVRLATQTRIVLSLTALLLGAGAGVILVLEWNGALAGHSWPGKLAHAFFQSATCRTAGFNTLPVPAFGNPALLIMMVLMFIGGAPGSTAGGIKVTTLAVMWANLQSGRHGFHQVRIGRREIDPSGVNRALIVVTSAAVAVALGTFVLLVLEGRDLMETGFEVVSAFGTVGLSLGLTPELSPLGRSLVIVLMFVGRLGPLTLAYGLTPAARDRQVRLPRTTVMVG